MLNFLTTTTVCGFSLYHVLAFFLIYSCTGWCLEVIFAAATTGQLAVSYTHLTLPTNSLV